MTGLLRADWKNFARPLWEREAVAKLDAYARTDTAQMVVLGGSLLVSVNSVIAPYDSGFQEGAVLDRTAGTITVGQAGLYLVFADYSGDASQSNSENLFNIRVNGVVVITLESTQKQAQEGVQASVTGQIQVSAGGVIDAFLTGDSDVTLQNMLLGVLWVRPLDGIVQV